MSLGGLMVADPRFGVNVKKIALKKTIWCRIASSPGRLQWRQRRGRHDDARVNRERGSVRMPPVVAFAGPNYWDLGCRRCGAGLSRLADVWGAAIQLR